MTIYLCAWRLIRSCSWMLKRSHALMIVLKSYGDLMIKFMCTWMFKCSCTCMLTCFADHVLIYVLALMIICLYLYLRWWSHASIFTCFDVHILLYSHALMITHTFFNYLILPCLHALMKSMSTCLYALMLMCTNSFMIACFYVHIICLSHASLFI